MPQTAPPLPCSVRVSVPQSRVPQSLHLRYSKQLMRLQAQSPARMIEAILEGGLRVGVAEGAVHGLQEKVAELERLELGRVGTGLRINQLQLVAGALHERGAGFGADAGPVDAGRSRDGSVGFDSNLKAAGVKSVDERGVELKQRLTAGADHESTAGCFPGKSCGRCWQLSRRG